MNEITKRVFIGTFLISTSILFGIIGVTYAENPRWTKITGPSEAKFDGCFNKIAIDQKRGIIYAVNGISAGICKSTNRGKTWEPINNGLPMVPSTSNYFPIVDIDISETSTETIYLTMRYRGVFKSARESNWMKRNGKRGYISKRLVSNDFFPIFSLPIYLNL